MEKSEEISIQSSRRKNNNNSKTSRQSSNFSSKCLSSNKLQPSYKRSNTKDDKKRGQGQKLSISTIEDALKNKKQTQVSVNLDSKKNFRINLQIHANSRANQKTTLQRKFVDSDFEDTRSFSNKIKFTNKRTSNRMGSISPLSSKVSLLKKREASLTMSSLKIDSENTQTQLKAQIISNQQRPKLALNSFDQVKTLPLNQKTRTQYSPVSHKLNEHSPQASAKQLQDVGAADPILIKKLDLRFKECERSSFEHLPSTSGRGDQESLRHKQKQAAQSVTHQQQKVLSHMYRKKLIERREKQVHIINKQLLNESESQRSTALLRYAISSTGRYDSIQNTADLAGKSDRKEYPDQTRAKAAKRLETLRRVQKQLNKTSKATRNKNLVIQSLRDTEKLGGKNNQGTKVSRLDESIFEEKICNRKNSILIAEGTSFEYNMDAYLEEKTLLNQSVASNNTIQGLYSRGIANDQQAGFKMTTEQSQELEKLGENAIQSEEQGVTQLKLNVRSSFPLKTTPDSASYSFKSFSRPFRVPKIKAAPIWQNVIERSFNMVQVEDEAFDFVPGKISQNIYKVGSKGINMSTQPRQRQHNQFSLEKSESPTDRSHKIQARKQSHELYLIRNQAITDEDRINKLANFSMSKQLKKQRIQLSIGGRDDPNNLLGYEKLGIIFPITMRAQRTQTMKRNQHLSSPLSNRNELNSELITSDKMTSTVQKNIYEMLSYLSRAKTVRIANQVLKEQQQQMYSVNNRREQVNGQESQHVSVTTKKLPRYTQLQSPQNRPRLIRQTMPKLPPLLTNSGNFSTGKRQQNVLFQKNIFPQSQGTYPIQQSQTKDSIMDST